MAAANLVAKDTFSAFGVDYYPGSVVAPADLAKWPEGTLVRRLEGGFVAYAEVEDVPVAPPKK